MPGGVQLLLDVIEFVLLAAGLAALYRYVPNTPVRRSHAWAGGFFAAIGIEFAKRLLALYLGMVPTYSARVRRLRDGADPAGVDLHRLGHRAAGRGDRRLPAQPAWPARAGAAAAHGWQFQLALEVLQQLSRARAIAAARR